MHRSFFALTETVAWLLNIGIEMKENVIVLTTGLSGSSVTTALIAQGDFWLGKETIVKNNSTGQYDTYENLQLVNLNKQLYKSLDFTPTQDALYDANVFEMFANCHDKVDTQEYEAFIKDCNENGAWLWKDPRLWNTIGFWLPLIKKHCGDSVKFVVLSRQPLSLWVSLLLKRNIVNYDFLKKSEKASAERLAGYLSDENFKLCDLNYNDLLSHPESTIANLNEFLGTSLTMTDMTNIFRGELPAKPWKWKDLVKASLIYLKNRSEAKRS